ncbi:gamma-glutamylcyclotransferase family protein [Haloplanus aerogenes]|uniref:Gamma-glutamyl AIG2-like cyclotransferase n=1 Tax=Haloplanus aerogenes TaxID=660522 RepID=A0A3M0DP63_9EURY|nr:gamma-glutamylcyclotransferase family protein [Haloplanus aerogenes]AZH24664.1 gamma-glutamylcyclotransferase [Haloplanus aerogenes]RMB23678.1 gamma-glutamyl AIG2-like cyclotransferase [Haloplanus aerogenes]
MDVFVYGTLTEPERVSAVVDSFVFVGAAVLEGCHPVTGRYPTLAPGGETAGRLLRTDDIEALDAYEGVDSGLYVRVSAQRTDGGTAAVYVGDPDRLDTDESVEWPGDGPFPARVRRYFDAGPAVVRPEHS